MATRTMDTEVDVPNPQLMLMPGMYAEVNLTLDHRPTCARCPYDPQSDGPRKARSLVVNARHKRRGA